MPKMFMFPLVSFLTIITLETTTPTNTTTTLSQTDLAKFNGIDDLDKNIYLLIHTTANTYCKLLITNISKWQNVGVNVYAGIGNINGTFCKVAVYPEDNEIKITNF